MRRQRGGEVLPLPALYQWLEPALGPIGASAVPVPTGPRTWWGGPLDVEGLALGSVQAAVASLHQLVGGHAQALGLGAAQVAASFASLSHLRVEARALEGFAPLSRFFPTADGWVRTHGNYPHHAAALQEVFGVSALEPLAAALLEHSAAEVEDMAQQAGGVAAAVRQPADWASTPMGQQVQKAPWIRFDLSSPSGAALRIEPQRQLAGIRVIDLTRVIAGPIGARFLAALGADVLRIDPPHLPELLGHHLDTGFGKRSACADLRKANDVTAVHELLEAADVLFIGYRPGALTRFGLDPAAVRDRYPHLAIVTIDAWGDAGPWRQRRGFDSVVQAATGIAHLYGSTSSGRWQPGALPVQALDHATGYGMAAAAIALLTRRSRDEGSGTARLSLAATAHQLLNMAGSWNGPHPVDVTLQTTSTPYGTLLHAPPPITRNGEPIRYPSGPDTYGTAPLRWNAAIDDGRQ